MCIMLLDRARGGFDSCYTQEYNSNECVLQAGLFKLRSEQTNPHELHNRS